MTNARLILSAILLFGAGVAPAADPVKVDSREAEAKLKKFRDADRADLKAYMARDWEAVRDRNPDLTQEAKKLEDVTDGLSQLEAAAKNLARAIGRSAAIREAEAKRFLTTIEDRKLAPNRAIDTLDNLSKAVLAVPVGVVGEESEAKFKLTADELAKDPKKVQVRLKARLDAMEKNVALLTENAKSLEGMVRRAKSGRDLVKKADDDADQFIHQGGVRDFSRDPLRRFFDGPKLTKQYRDLAEIAEEKQRRVKVGIDAQRRQIGAFKKVMDDLVKGG
jgi:hypothetical protein